jgi:hypothetical protein
MLTWHGIFRGYATRFAPFSHLFSPPGPNHTLGSISIGLPDFLFTPEGTPPNPRFVFDTQSIVLAPFR